MQKCSNMCQNFQTALKIYNKFDNVWTKLGAKDISIEKDCCEKLKRMVWLVYLLTKQEVIDKDISQGISGNLLDQAFLLIAVCQLFVINVKHDKYEG